MRRRTNRIARIKIRTWIRVRVRARMRRRGGRRRVVEIVVIVRKKSELIEQKFS